MSFNSSFTPYTKANSEWFIDLNIQPKTVKLLEENIGEALDNDLGSSFLDMIAKAQEIKLNKWDYIEL